jgi:predicted O-methyltransferase YrrM
MLATLVESLSLAYGHWLWTRHPEHAKSLLFNHKLGFRGGAARRYYIKVLEPNLACSEIATTVYNSRCQMLVQKSDFEDTQQVFEKHGFEINGILPLESIVLSALVRHYRPNIIFESGTYRGQSGVVLCEALARLDIPIAFHTISPNEDNSHEVARQRLSTFPFAEIHEGHSEKILPLLLKATNAQSVALFLDGPKAYDNAFTAVLDTVDCPEQLSFIAIHDCEWTPPSPGMTLNDEKLERLRLTDWFARSKLRHTHELWFMDNAWCERNYHAWSMLPANPPGGVGPHRFSASRQFSPTAVLGVISRRQ